MHSDDMFAPVGLLRVVECHSEPKQEEETLGEVGGATDGVGSSGAKYGILEEGRQQQDSTRRTAAGAPTSEAPDALAQVSTYFLHFFPSKQYTYIFIVIHSMCREHSIFRRKVEHSVLDSYMLVPRFPCMHAHTHTTTLPPMGRIRTITLTTFS